MAKSPVDDSALPQLPAVSCTNCGVCCFHMGYPAYVMPRAPLTADQVDQLQTESGTTFSNARRNQLLAGQPGESHWHRLPADLKQELQAYIADYQLPQYGETLESFDGPCIWFDMETRLCKNHEVRPNVCRDFETGNPECLSWRQAYADRILPDTPSN